MASSAIMTQTTRVRRERYSTKSVTAAFFIVGNKSPPESNREQKVNFCQRLKFAQNRFKVTCNKEMTS